MARAKVNPRSSKRCAFCKFWSGDAQLKFVDRYVGFEYERSAKGKCMKNNATMYAENSGSCCRQYTPGIEAEKLL